MEDAGALLIEAIATAVAEKFSKTAMVRKRLFTLSETAEYMGLSVDAIKDLKNSDKLKSINLIRKLLFDINDIDECIASARKK